MISGAPSTTDLGEMRGRVRFVPTADSCTGTSVNPSGPAASRVDFRRSRLGAKSGAARRLGAKPRRSAKADIGLAADGKGLGQHPSLDLP
jgi:hypothetical protein